MGIYRERQFFTPQTCQVLAQLEIVSTSHIFWKQDRDRWYLVAMRWQAKELPAYWLQDFIGDAVETDHNCSTLWGDDCVSQLCALVQSDNKEAFILEGAKAIQR